MPRTLLTTVLILMIAAVFGVIIQRHLLPTFGHQPTYLDEIRGSMPKEPAGTYLEEIGAELDLPPPEDAPAEPEEEPEPEEFELPPQFRVDQGAGLPRKKSS